MVGTSNSSDTVIIAMLATNPTNPVNDGEESIYLAYIVCMSLSVYLCTTCMLLLIEAQIGYQIT